MKIDLVIRGQCCFVEYSLRFLTFWAEYILCEFSLFLLYFYEIIDGSRKDAKTPPSKVVSYSRIDGLSQIVVTFGRLVTFTSTNNYFLN